MFEELFERNSFGRLPDNKPPEQVGGRGRDGGGDFEFCADGVLEFALGHALLGKEGVLAEEELVDDDAETPEVALLVILPVF